ncbi:MAG: hypothetical protein CGU29_06035 [Candidatus Dactylopiibacterium carminicum]|uniref:Phosphoglycerate mutase n=1 Tax=Candidatus Dactylopiibacterium carminicum TaxID=857335 RepID=A0A272EUM0_9RHOO|nr:hypothetical protein BGI27_03085 [Candidatus Dactylopiibacterium carminicum]PAS93793.1 MAG: hypothetical protein CGU29_06035 [Candidatus Dactylopiibacterium carminicum]
MRRLGEEDGAVRPGRWLCADPVHLHMTRDALLLRGPDELDVDTQESLALVDTLNQEFSELGQFHVATPQRWYLQLRGPAQADFHPLVDVLGRPVSQFTPEGTDARRWNLHANAIQILLHNHPVNAARQARGALPINGLWLWGAGEPDTGLPALPAILSEDPLLRGFARHHGAGIVADADSLLASGGWWHDSRLHQAMLATDPHAWLTALAELEDVLFRPLLTAWRAGRIDALYLHAPGDQHALTATLTRRARWALWRRPLSPARLSALLQGSA